MIRWGLLVLTMAGVLLEADSQYTYRPPELPCSFNGECICARDPAFPNYAGITCSGVLLSAAPEFPELLTEFIRIEGSGIRSLDETSFGNVSSYSMYLDNNNIVQIANYTFRYMTRSLREITISNNDLTEVPFPAVNNLDTVRILLLDGNQISSVIGKWGVLGESLETMNISRNDIDSIPLNPETSLASLKRLKDINLSKNLLVSLEANSLPYGLKRVNASQNFIKEFPHDLVNALQDLTELDLSENSIENLTEHKFSGRRRLDLIDLSYNKLSRLRPWSRGEVKVSRFNLRRNNISEVEREAFSGLDVKSIDLSSNRLEKLHDASLKGTEASLERLSLSQNRFSKVPDGLKELKGLKSFDLSYNNLTKVKNSLYYFSGLEELSLAGNTIGVFPVDALGPLKVLRSLDLSYNTIADIRKSDFKAWGKQLEKLYLQSNSLFFLGDSTFEYTPKLNELSLSYNTIGDISLNAFKNLDNVERLDVSFSLKGYGFPTPLLSMKSLKYLYLDNNNINDISKEITKIDKIKTLILDFNRIKEVQLGTFDSKAHKYLEDLRLSYNFIYKIDSNTFSELNSLRTLSLHDNRIMKISEYGFNDLPQNISIYLSGNRIDEISKHAFRELPRMKLLDLHGNNIQTFDYNIFQNVTSVSYQMTLNLSRNRIDTIKVPDYERIPVYIAYLDLSHNKLTKVPEKVVEIQTALRSLMMGYNNIPSIESKDFYGMVNLYTLDLVHNKITVIRDKSFVSLENLHQLNISHNHLEELGAGLFSSLKRLRVLDLSHNNIRTISNSAFDNTKIENLYLGNNKITFLNPSTFLNAGKTLRVLDLSYNQIARVDSNLLLYLPKLQDLNFCHNNLTNDSLPVFQNLGLLNLELCGNRLAKVPVDGLRNMSSLRQLNLAETGLESLPNLTLPSLTVLNLAGNKLTNISGGWFSGLPHLRTLFLRSNNIAQLTNIQWIQAPNLRELDLSRNSIRVLDKPCFFGLYNLKKLNIQELEQLERLDSGVFMDLEKVTSLRVDYAWRFNLNLNETLSHLRYLREVSLLVKDSKLTVELPALLPHGLRSVELTGRTLSSVDPDSLRSLRQYYDLRLAITGTAIAAFPKHFFNPFKGRGFSLDLSHNELTRIGPEIFFNTLGDIRRYGTKAFSGGIEVSGNKLECGCETKWLAEWLRRQLVETQGVNRGTAGERLELIEGLAGRLSCHDRRSQEEFPILTYDLTTDEKLCGIVLNVPKVRDDGRGTAGPRSALSSLLLIAGALLTAAVF